MARTEFCAQYLICEYYEDRIRHNYASCEHYLIKQSLYYANVYHACFFGALKRQQIVADNVCLFVHFI